MARRESLKAATAEDFRIDVSNLSICEPDGMKVALDHDLIFSCVDDHPWPRAVLNAMAYSDLIPVIDGASLLTPSMMAGCVTLPGDLMSSGLVGLA